MTQFVAVQFGGAGRSYTYRNDGKPVAVGDSVVVASRGGEATVKVLEITDEAPPFATKPIIRKAPDKAPAPDEAKP
jgi:hypothetical protein